MSARLVFLHCEMDRRNMTVMAVSLGLGLGVATRSDAIAGLPPAAETFFGQPVILTALSALVLNTLAPGDRSPLFDAEEPPAPEPAPPSDD